MSEFEYVSLRAVDDVHRLLAEVAGLLDSLLESGQGGSIEVSTLSLTDEDYDFLDECLGKGEVSAEIMGPTPVHVLETGISGVWWITHLSDEDEIIAEFIEVAFCPAIVSSPVEDVAEGLDGLRARLFEAHLGRGGRGRE